MISGLGLDADGKWVAFKVTALGIGDAGCGCGSSPKLKTRRAATMFVLGAVSRLSSGMAGAIYTGHSWSLKDRTPLEVAMASSTSTSRQRTMLSSLERPSSRCTHAEINAAWCGAASAFHRWFSHSGRVIGWHTWSEGAHQCYERCDAKRLLLLRQAD